MKRFIKDVILTSAIGILVVLALEIVMRLTPSDNIYAFKYNYMEANSSKIKTLLLGHSLFEESFNNNVLGDSTFNLAICGRVSYYDVKLLERYIDRMENIEVVIFPIHYALDNPCDHYGDKQGEEAYVYHYFKDMKIRTPGSMRLYYSPKVTFQWGEKHSGIMPGLDPVDDCGYCRFSNEEGHIYPPSERRYTQAYTEPFGNNLRRIAQICFENQVRLITVTPPVTDVFLSCTTTEGIYVIDSIIMDIRKDYPIEYHNYLADSSFRSNSLYHDCSHLNHKGATLFAQRVKTDFNL